MKFGASSNIGVKTSAFVGMGIGPASAQRLKRLGICSLRDLLYYFPKRYYDFSLVLPVADAPAQTQLTVAITLDKIKNRNAWKRRGFTITEGSGHDATGTIKLIWFNQAFVADTLKVGQQYYVAGKITEDKYGRHFTNPIVELVKLDTTHTARIVPHYPLTKGLTQKQLRYFIKQTLQMEAQSRSAYSKEWLPAPILERFNLQPIADALQSIHFPNSETDLQQSRFRLGFDELLPIHLFVRLTKNQVAQERAVALPFQTTAIQTFVRNLPFKLTVKQRRVAWDILQDLAKTQPMNRLVEGDVGAGKTVIALMAMYQVALTGYQAVFLAPTELLAEQHYQKMTSLLTDPTVTIGLVTRNTYLTNTARPTPSQDINILVGTHALLEDKILFGKTALVVIDEQHRFGVAQRQRLKTKANLAGAVPHLVSMTATPIPRSLTLALYGDLAISLLDELPPGRKPITTTYITPDCRSELYGRVKECLARHEQVFIVAPRITEDDELESDITSVEREYARWHRSLPKINIAKLHGQLKTAERQQIMHDFRAGKIDVLIATTVIEVGVDIPNASVMIIENADRFGLAQLHQLRGRVGRSDKPAYCFVCSDSTNPGVSERLLFFTQTTSGFALAEYDLDRRGPGDVYGQDQSGFLSSLKIARLSDGTLLKAVTAAADELFPQLHNWPLVEQRVNQFIRSVHLE
ncbi:MAG: hypothetical protein ACD_43C00192G0002 [uncultured bacterium]|nr:MAG: hypothetical protein ACD_43C00192G0002 [uncultured bacterium]